MLRSLRLSSSAVGRMAATVSRNYSAPSTSTQGVQLSPACVKQLKSVSGGGEFLRITVDSGGCSGFEYKFELDKSELQADDKLFEKDGARVVIDETSLSFIQGATIDYHRELIKSAFRVIDNPLADTKCSCGASFSMKM